jgi:hypothetical protein
MAVFVDHEPASPADGPDRVWFVGTATPAGFAVTAALGPTRPKRRSRS